ncbi:MAG: AraC family ligand binding domain-containing protein [Proteobacteria bacterium]|nr:AraC family ligand binding domain-containing protein [Pseudomonadota bacterium]
MQRHLVTVALAAIAAGPGFSVAASADRDDAHTGSHVPASEIDAAVSHMGPDPVADTVLRVVPIGTEYNVGVSVVRRATENGRAPPDAIVHDKITEVYHVVEGSGVLVTGGTLENSKQLPADSAVVQKLIGPSSIGTGIAGGTRQRVQPGDVLIIPPGTPHGFVEINGKRILYTLVRIDRDRILEVATPGAQ